MAFPSGPLDSCLGTRLSRYPTNRPTIDNTGHIEGKEPAASSQQL